MKQPIKKQPRTANRKPERVAGLDLGDRYSHYCVLTGDGELVEEGRLQSTEGNLRKQFANEPRMRIALEAGTHSPWVSRLLESFGHEVLVANPHKIRAITSSESKNDRNDAEKLARFAACDPKLLSPIRHRSPERQQDLNLIHARSSLVRARTGLVNALRGLVKSAGGRLGACSPKSFPNKMRTAIPAELQPAAAPLVEQIAQLNIAIAGMDHQVEALGDKHPEIKLLRTVPGVGPIVAACYVLTLDRPDIIPDNRQAGAFLGLRPRQSQSGDKNPPARHLQDRQHLLAKPVSAGGALHPGLLRAGLGAASLGTRPGRQRRQARQKTRRGRRRPQAGRVAAQHVAQSSAIHTLPPIFHTSHRRGLNPDQKHTGTEGRK